MSKDIVINADWADDVTDGNIHLQICVCVGRRPSELEEQNADLCLPSTAEAENVGCHSKGSLMALEITLSVG